jgi:hypothetical protein
MPTQKNAKHRPGYDKVYDGEGNARKNGNYGTSAHDVDERPGY